MAPPPRYWPYSSWSAASALAALPSIDDTWVLADAVRCCRAPQVRAAAAARLVSRHDRNAEGFVWMSPDKAAREALAAALAAAAHDPEVTARVRAMASHPHLHVRMGALPALASLGDTDTLFASATALDGPERELAVRLLSTDAAAIARLLQHPEPRVRATALWYANDDQRRAAIADPYEAVAMRARQPTGRPPPDVPNYLTSFNPVDALYYHRGDLSDTADPLHSWVGVTNGQPRGADELVAIHALVWQRDQPVPVSDADRPFLQALKGDEPLLDRDSEEGQRLRARALAGWERADPAARDRWAQVLTRYGWWTEELRPGLLAALADDPDLVASLSQEALKTEAGLAQLRHLPVLVTAFDTPLVNTLLERAGVWSFDDDTLSALLPHLSEEPRGQLLAAAGELAVAWFRAREQAPGWSSLGLRTRALARSARHAKPEAELAWATNGPYDPSWFEHIATLPPSGPLTETEITASWAWAPCVTDPWDLLRRPAWGTAWAPTAVWAPMRLDTTPPDLLAWVGRGVGKVMTQRTSRDTAAASLIPRATEMAFSAGSLADAEHPVRRAGLSGASDVDQRICGLIQACIGGNAVLPPPYWGYAASRGVISAEVMARRARGWSANNTLDDVDWLDTSAPEVVNALSMDLLSRRDDTVVAWLAHPAWGGPARLLSWLNGQDGRARLVAARAIGAGGAACWDAAVQLARSGERVMREAVCWSAHLFGPDAIVLITPLLFTTDESIAEAAREALDLLWRHIPGNAWLVAVQRPDAEVLAANARLLKHPEGAVRELVVRLVADRMKSAQGSFEPWFSLLERLADDPDPRVQAKAVPLLVRAGRRPLSQLTEVNYEELATILIGAKLRAEPTGDGVTVLREIAATRRDEVGAGAAAWLSWHGLRRAPAADDPEALIALDVAWTLRNPDQAATLWSSWSAEEREARAAAWVFAGAAGVLLLASLPPDARRLGVRLLRSDTVEDLILQCRSGDIAVATAALRLLQERSRDHVDEALTGLPRGAAALGADCGGDGKLAQRLAVAQADADDDEPALVTHARTSRSRWVRRAAVMALARRGRRDVLAAVLHDEEEPAIRAAALSGLHDRTLLRTALHDTSGRVRQVALERLAESPEPEDLDAIARLLDSRDRLLRSRAASALAAAQAWDTLARAEAPEASLPMWWAPDEVKRRWLIERLDDPPEWVGARLEPLIPIAKALTEGGIRPDTVWRVLGADGQDLLAAFESGAMEDRGVFAQWLPDVGPLEVAAARVVLEHPEIYPRATRLVEAMPPRLQRLLAAHATAWADRQRLNAGLTDPETRERTLHAWLGHHDLQAPRRNVIALLRKLASPQAATWRRRITDATDPRSARAVLLLADHGDDAPRRKTGSRMAVRRNRHLHPAAPAVVAEQPLPDTPGHRWLARAQEEAMAVPNKLGDAPAFAPLRRRYRQTPQVIPDLTAPPTDADLPWAGALLRELGPLHEDQLATAHADWRPLLLTVYARQRRDAPVAEHLLSRTLLSPRCVERALREVWTAKHPHQERIQDLLAVGVGTLETPDWPSFPLVVRPSIRVVTPEVESALVVASRDLDARVQALATAPDLDALLAALLATEQIASPPIAAQWLADAAAWHYLGASGVMPTANIRRKHLRAWWRRTEEAPPTLPKLRAVAGPDGLLRALTATLLGVVQAPSELTPAQSDAAAAALRALVNLWRLPPAVAEPAQIADRLLHATQIAPRELAHELGIGERAWPTRAGNARNVWERAASEAVRKAAAGRLDLSGETQSFTLRPMSRLEALKRGDRAGDCSSQTVPLRALLTWQVFYEVVQVDRVDRGYIGLHEVTVELPDGQSRPALCVETINVPITGWEAVQYDILRLFEAVAHARGLGPGLVLSLNHGTWNYSNQAILRSARPIQRAPRVRIRPIDEVGRVLYTTICPHESHYDIYRANGREEHLLFPRRMGITALPENEATAVALTTIGPR